MFKDFIKQDLSNEIYGITALCVFVCFFVALAVFVISYRKSFLDKAGRMPLDEEDLKNYEL